MKTLRRSLFAATMVIASATFALGGEIQFPGKSDPPPPPPVSVSTAESATDGMTMPSTETFEIGWQGLATAMLKNLLLTIY